MNFLKICVLVLVGSTYAFAGGVHYDLVFSNGNRVEARVEGVDPRTHRVVFRERSGREREITSDPLLRFSYSETQPTEVEVRLPEMTSAGPADEHITIFENERGFWFVTENGAAEQIPVDLSNALRKQRSTVHSKLSLQEGKHNFLLVSFRNYAEGHSNGETFVIRDDGTWLRVDYSYHDVRNEDALPLVRNGILSIPECHRRIDLQHFDGERRFQPAVPKPTLDEEGKEEVDPVKAVEKYFPEMVADAKKRLGQPRTVYDRDWMLKLRAALLKPEGGSAVILGESGTGKTWTLKALAEGIAAGEFPELPRTLRLVYLDAASITAGTKFVGTFEARVKMLVEAAKVVPTILVMDEMHALRGAGTHSGSQADFFEFVKGPLGDGSLRGLGTSNDQKYYPTFAGDGPILRRFTPVTKTPPVGKEALPAFHSWMRKEGKAPVGDDLLMYAHDLSEKFGAWGSQPGKTTSLLGTSFAWMELTRPDAKALDRQALEEGAKQLYGNDPAQFDPALRRKKIQAVRRELDEKLVGVTAYKDAFVGALELYLAGLHEPGRPAMRILASGPPGNGKTDVPKAASKVLGWGFKRVDMPRYAKGNPAGLLAEMAQSLRENAFTVFVLDEFDWAHPEVQAAVLAVLDSGEFTVDELNGSSGVSGFSAVKVSAKNAMFVLTSNAGTSYLRNLGRRFGISVPTDTPVQSEEQALKEAIIADGVSPAVLSRCLNIVPVFSSSDMEFGAVLRIHFQKALDEIAKSPGLRVTLANPDAFYSAMVKRYFRPNMDNRLAHQAVQTYLRLPLAKYALEHESDRDVELHLDVEHLAVSFRVRNGCGAQLNEQLEAKR